MSEEHLDELMELIYSDEFNALTTIYDDEPLMIDERLNPAYEASNA